MLDNPMSVSLPATGEFFRALFEQANDAFFLVDAQTGRFIDANRTALDRLGYTKEELLSLTVPEIHPAEDAPRVIEALESVRAGRSVVSDGMFHRRKDGRLIPIEVSANLIEIGGKGYALGLVRDVTERQRQRGELEEAKAFLEHLQENANDGLVLLDAEGRYVSVNRKMLEISGRRKEDYLGRHFLVNSPPEYVEGYKAHWAQLMAGQTVRMQTRMVTPRGEERIVDVSSSPIRRGGQTYVFAIVRDVTERVRGEEAVRKSAEELAHANALLRESEAKFRAVVDTVPDAIFIQDEEGRILAVNPAAAACVRRKPEELVGRTIHDLFPAETARQISEEDRRVIESGAVRAGELLIPLPGGDRLYHVTRLPYRSADGKVVGVLGVARDVTEERRGEEEPRFRKTLLESQTEAAVDGILVVSREGKMISFNRRFVEMWGIPPPVVASRSDDAAIRSVLDKLVDPEGFLARVRYLYEHPDEESRDEIVLLDGRVFDRFSAPVKSAEGVSYGRVWFFRDITDRKRAEDALRAIAEGTAFATGEGFFRSLVRHLALALGVRWGLLAECLGEPPDRARTLAFWAGGDFAPNVEYDLQGTPCEKVLEGEVCVYPDQVQVLFPGDRPLVEMGARSYLGAPLVDSTGRTLGHLAVVDDRPLLDAPRKVSILKIFAARAAGELERRRAEQALLDSMARSAALADELGLLLAHTQDFVYRHDAGGVFTYVSPAVEQITGYTPQEWLVHYTKFLTDHPLNQKVIEHTEETLRTGKQSPPYLVEIFHKEGRRVLLEVSERAYREDGRVAGIVGVARDVTERKHAEEELRKLSRAVEASSAIVLVTNARREVEYVNPRFTQVTGYKPEEMIGRDARELGTQTSDHFRDMWETISSGREWRGEFLNRKKSGEIYWEQAAISPVVDAKGEITHFIKVAEDVTAKKQAERRTAAQYALTRILAESASLGEATPLLLKALCEGLGWDLGAIWRLDREGEVLQCVELWKAGDLDAPEFEAETRRLAFARGEGLPGRVWAREKPVWFADVVSERHYTRAAQAREAGLHAAFGFPILSGPQILGVMEFMSRQVLQPDEDLQRLMGAIGSQIGQFIERRRAEDEIRRAVEETRRAYEDLKRAQAQLIRSEKLASIGMLVSGVAHEINNPLNVIFGNLKLLAGKEGGEKSASKVRGMLRDALKAAEHAKAIVEDFRNFARDARTAELVDLNQCLEEALALMRREFRSRIRVVKRLGKLPAVRCFRGQIGQVFLNLLKNAGEAIDRKGTITLRTFRRDGHAVVEVTDTGRGIPEDLQKKLFEPFFTTKPVGKGMGLGLSISAMILNNHGGDISVESRVGRGTLFRIRLPIP